MTETVWGKIEVRQQSVPHYHWTWVIHLSWNDSRKWEHSVETQWVYKMKSSALAAAKVWMARLGVKEDYATSSVVATDDGGDRGG